VCIGTSSYRRTISVDAADRRRERLVRNARKGPAGLDLFQGFVIRSENGARVMTVLSVSDR
jgi:hypothetical protein